ncbi:MAG: ABC-three component system protein [Candidatus Absconditabacteria bacterium]
MRKYDYHKISDDDFETLVGLVCKARLGDGFTGFSKGRDGGRDGTFNGTAYSFPSKSNPRKGTFIIQSKHSNSATTSISDTDFFSPTAVTCLINKEIEKILKLKEQGENIENYIIFTNRSNPGNKHQEIIDYISNKTGIQNVFLFTSKRLDDHFAFNPKIIESYDLSYSMEPLDIRSQDIANIIDGMYSKFQDLKKEGSSFPDDEFTFMPIIEKAKLNNMSESYLNTAIEEYDVIYPKIQYFMGDPKNLCFQKKYSEIIAVLRDEISSKKVNYKSMDEIFNEVYNLIESEDIFSKNEMPKVFIKVFLGFAFANCDLGEKITQESAKKISLDKLL